MDKPTWVKVIGILAIVFGCLGILGSMNMIVMPKIMQFQASLFESIEKEARHDPQFPSEMMKVLKEFWDMPPWMQTWAIVFGCVWIVVNVFYLLSGIMLLQMKPYSVRLIIFALGLKMLVGVVQGVTAVSDGSLIGFMFMAGSIFGFVIDLVLLIVVLISDKRAFGERAVPASSG